ncbi:hypothetical protein GFD25_01390 [Bifidobacterium aerophilum]|uniref:Uncharacterized protein n=2 Tax=Bifidobacterium aerophilum TaxID=1798155 RepID=A0A6N9Z2L5_9BIFI|nr:hypothetical protein [Bifidobacterium aerophilum]
MSNKGGKFTEQEVMYLMSRPAVENATVNRITYSDAFKRDCLRRYLDGESPVRLFREAGLPPELVGYKRIERAFSRWKENRDEILDGNDTDQHADMARFAAAAPSGTFDVRDTLIVQQIHRIAELEHQVAALKVVVASKEKTASTDASSEASVPPDTLSGE